MLKHVFFELPGQLFNVLTLWQRFAHARYLLGCEIIGTAAKGETADVPDVGIYGGRVAGGKLLRILRTAIRCRRQILRVMSQSEAGHRRCVAVLRGWIAMHDAHLAVAVAVWWWQLIRTVRHPWLVAACLSWTQVSDRRQNFVLIRRFQAREIFEDANYLCDFFWNLVQ